MALLLFLLMQCTGSAPCDLKAKVSTVHHATLYYQSTSCTTSTPCSIHVYRNTCATPDSCPPYGNGKGWTSLIAGVAAANPTATGTTWIIQDQDTSLKDATTYVYVARLSWLSSPKQLSAAGPPWSGTTSGSSSIPNAPTLGANNSVH